MKAWLARLMQSGIGASNIPDMWSLGFDQLLRGCALSRVCLTRLEHWAKLFKSGIATLTPSKLLCRATRLSHQNLILGVIRWRAQLAGQFHWDLACRRKQGPVSTSRRASGSPLTGMPWTTWGGLFRYRSRASMSSVPASSTSFTEGLPPLSALIKTCQKI